MACKMCDCGAADLPVKKRVSDTPMQETAEVIAKQLSIEKVGDDSLTQSYIMWAYDMINSDPEQYLDRLEKAGYEVSDECRRTNQK